MPETDNNELTNGKLIPIDQYMKIKWANEYTLGSGAFFVLALCVFLFVSKKRLKKILTVEKTVYESKGEGFSQDNQEFFVPPSRVVSPKDLKPKTSPDESREKFIRERSEHMFASITSIQSLASLEKKKTEATEEVDTKTENKIEEMIADKVELKTPENIEIQPVKVVEKNGIKWASFSVDAEFIFDEKDIQAKKP